MGRRHGTANTNTASSMTQPDELPDPDAEGLIPLDTPFDYGSDELIEILAAFASYTRSATDDNS